MGDIYLGNTEIEKVYIGNTSIYEKGVSAPYIVNPLDGAEFGNSDYRGGVYTHQYQLSSGNVIDAYFLCNDFASTILHYSSANVSEADVKTGAYIYREMEFSGGASVQITKAGLLILSLPEIPSSNHWMTYSTMSRYAIVLMSDEGAYFVDWFNPYNYISCFIKSTKISLVNGETISVEDVDYNDDLLVWNFDEGKYDSAKPLWIKKTETTTWYYKLKFSNGLELKVTGTYPEAHSLFSVEDGRFTHANKLVGKKVYTLDGIATLESCEEVRENVEFYNIITNYHMNLFADNVLTSTSLNNLYPIKDMKFIKEDREPVFDYSQFSDDWIVGARLKEQPTDVTKYCLDKIKLSK